MKIAIAQINPIVADLAGNVRRCLEAVDRAQSAGAELVVFPEMALPGSPAQDILLDSSFVDAAGLALADLAVQTRSAPPVIIGSIQRSAPTRSHPGLLNTAFLLHRGVIQPAASKQVLRADDVFHEPRWFLPGTPAAPLTLNGTRLGVVFASDLHDPQIVNGWKEQDAECLICLAAEHYTPDAFARRVDLARAAGKALVYANLWGGNDELIYDGRSFALSARGDVQTLAAFAGDIQIVDPQTVPAIPPPSLAPEQELFDALTLGIRDFLHKNGIRRVFLGLSGGVDSALAACLAAAACRPEEVTAVSIPSRYTDPRSVDTARELSAALGIGIEVCPLEPLHRAAEESLGPLLSAGTGAENIQARLRAMLLMSYVNRYGGLLLNTTNKTELCVGYITLYGDMAGMLSPLGDLTKLQVFQLARWINAARPIIPDFILERAPTAELRPGQVDPFDYEQVVPELEALVQANQSNAAMCRAEYKRRQMGVILKVSARAFGSGRMVPITRR